ncbi:MAG: ParB/RepB/Spo0J family partition protein [Leptospirales bacterium]|nr:ParB/RepB/Spo0J family partition protein [Leptospirales bacterium]
MNSKTKRLGALTDIYRRETLDGVIQSVKLNRLRPSSEQPRQQRTINIDELAESIKREGLLSPLVVTRDGEGFRIIAGERRYHALKKLGRQEAECRIISREERDYWRIAIVENLQRENLSPGEEAQALLRLKKQEDLSDQSLAELVGKSRNYVTEILGIAQLPTESLEQCVGAGIDSRNLLIQAVQAYRKQQLPEFLAAYRSGAIKTVRDAREFLQPAPATGEGGAAQGKASPATGKPKASQAVDAIVAPRVELRENELLVICRSSDEARRLRDRLKKSWAELLGGAARP